MNRALPGNVHESGASNNFPTYITRSSSASQLHAFFVTTGKSASAVLPWTWNLGLQLLQKPNIILGNRKKSQEDKNREQGSVRSNSCVVVGKELTLFQCTVGQCVVMLESPVSTMPQFRHQMFTHSCLRVSQYSSVLTV